MKRLLSLVLCAVLLFSVLGAPAWAADGDQLTVHAKSGGTRRVNVGDTFTYTYSLRLLGTYELDRVKLDVIFDPACLEVVQVEYPSFPTGSATETVNNGDLRMEKSAIPNGAAYSQSIKDIITVTFRAKRAGDTYVRTLPDRIEVENNVNSDIYLVEQYRPSAARNTLFSTYDYLGENAPTNASTKLNTSQDVVWLYVTDKTTNQPVAQGQSFTLTGTDEDGKVQTFSAVTDAYGMIVFPRVPFGNYVLTCTSTLPDGSGYTVLDPCFKVPMVKSNGDLDLRQTVQVRPLQPDDMRDITITLNWTDEFIEPGVPYKNDRPANVFLELESGGVTYARTYLQNTEKSVTLERLPLTDEAGNALNYQLFPGSVDHYETTVLPTETGFAVTFRYLNDHDWKSDTVEPDCTTAGEKVYTCADCNQVYHYTLAPLGHDLAISGYDATCTREGYHLYVCKRCDYYYAENTPAKGHTWGEWITDQEATATEDGLMHRFCTVCGERENRVLASQNHQHAMTTHVIEPTCTEGGYTEMVCGCGEHFVVEGSRTVALGHDFTGNSATRTVIPNSCTEKGLVEYTCTRCGEMHAEVVPAHGHNYGVVEIREADCTHAGSTIYECSYCGNRHTERSPVLGHQWSDWIIDRPATATTPGAQHRICERCHQEEDAVIPVTQQGHTHHYDKSETVAPTCTEEGYTKWICPDDGASFIDPDSKVEPLGHSWKESWRTPSTTRTRGVVCYECDRCGILRYEALPKQDGGAQKSFWDVNSGDWFYEPVRYVSYNDYMQGTSSTRFEPNSPMTRAMLVTVLWRMVDKPSVAGLSMPFVDVPARFEDGSECWYHDAVLWAYETGVVKGTSDTTFSPDTLINREQMVTIFHRYADYAGYDTSEVTSIMGYADWRSVSDWARNPMGWAVRAGIVTGVLGDDGVTYLQPQGTATRAQAAAIIQRFDAWRLK